MQAIAPIGDVRDAQVFARGQKIFHPLRNQRAQRNLKRQRCDVDVVPAAGRGMQVDAVVADAN